MLYLEYILRIHEKWYFTSILYECSYYISYNRSTFSMNMEYSFDIMCYLGFNLTELSAYFWLTNTFFYHMDSTLRKITNQEWDFRHVTKNLNLVQQNHDDLLKELFIMENLKIYNVIRNYYHFYVIHAALVLTLISSFEIIMFIFNNMSYCLPYIYRQ